MRLRLFIGACWLVTASVAYPQSAARGLASSPSSSSSLAQLWSQLASSTNSWAAPLRKIPGWETLPNRPFNEVRTLGEQGIGLAQFRLGYCYFFGEGVERDEKQAVLWLTRAANQGLAPAQFLLGEACLKGIGTSEDFAGGVDWLDKAAEQGFADAELLLGLCYLSGGPGVNQAPARGVKWLLRAAEQGNSVAQQSAGECYLVGNGVRPDGAEAVKWFTQAAGQGLATAQNLLAGCYLTGQGVATNSALAYAWYSRAAKQGLGLAQAALARCCANGFGVAKSADEAMRWWGAAAASGYPGAEFHLGLGYYRGEGVGKNLEKAVASFRKDAGREHVGALLYLGLCYWLGEGTEHDPSQARSYWAEACIQGITPRRYVFQDEAISDASQVENWWRDVAGHANASLQCCLAESYHFGHGVPPDDAQALSWYRKAAEQGDLVALKRAAWLLATSQNPKLRDGQSAVRFAERAATDTHHRDASILDTLAAAYAEAGRFDQAVRTETQAVAGAQRDDEKAEYQARLKLYQGHTAYRSDPPL